MYKSIIICFFICFFAMTPIRSEIKHSKIRPEPVYLSSIEKEDFFGSFWESIHNYFNGPFGLSAEEIQNRGFDDIDYNSNPKYWEYFGNANHTLLEGGYNINGRYYQYIECSETQIGGISQDVYIQKGVSHEFYGWFKTTNLLTTAYISLTNKNDGEIIFLDSINIISNIWTKAKFIIAPFDKNRIVKLNIQINNKSDLSIDEVSLMPQNAVFGIKKEYYDLYKIWKPKFIRYPGGYYADTEQAHWKYGIGNRDQRKSPNNLGDESQRMEIGTDEFINFCHQIGAEPHLVVNLQNGTTNEAADWLEYCNGKNNSSWAIDRRNNGHDMPYNVKYWEIGNEQWNNQTQTINKYLNTVQEMRDRANKENIESPYLFFDGSYWGAEPYFISSINKIKNFTNNYNWHYSQKADLKNYDDDEIYNSIVSNTVFFERYLNNLEHFLINSYSQYNIEQSITEYWIFYNEWDWHLNSRLFTMENGVWTALINNMAQRKSQTVKLIERTHNSGMFFVGYDSENNRIIAPTPAFWVCAMQNIHRGFNQLAVSIDSPVYSQKQISGAFETKHIPVIDVSASESKDSIFISIVNRSAKDTIINELDLSKFDVKDSIIEYVLNSGHILDGPTLNHPSKIVPMQKTLLKGEPVIMAPHSLSIIALCKNIPNMTKYVYEFNKLTVFPNPCNSNIEISFLKPLVCEGIICIYNETGQLIKQDFMQSACMSAFIDCSLFLPGVYFVNIYSCGYLYSTQFLKI